ncbi:MAG: hypothetical protein Q4C60_00005, partial [Eubacteriales bacterium]|nr:hypothetical protein [Eubacteriales bacterium]
VLFGRPLLSFTLITIPERLAAGTEREAELCLPRDFRIEAPLCRPCRRLSGCLLVVFCIALFLDV